jgi:hypothetical protein
LTAAGFGAIDTFLAKACLATGAAAIGWAAGALATAAGFGA